MATSKILHTGEEIENRERRRFEPGGRRQVLELADLSSVTVHLSEVERLPGLDGMWKETSDRFVVFNEGKMAQRFLEVLNDKEGPLLELAARSLFLGDVHDEKVSDFDRFCGWAANRSQPLAPKLIEDLGRFYAKRLNNVLGKGLSKTKENKSGRNPPKRDPHRVMKVSHPAPSAG